MDVVLILGAYHTGDGTLSECGKVRVEHAASILNEHPDAMAVITGGIPVGSSPVSDALGNAGIPHRAAVHRELTRQGIGEDRILARLDRATSTVLEAAETADFLEGRDYDSLQVVTPLAGIPRVPFIFMHFFPTEKLRFLVVADGRAKDVLMFTMFKEAEAYHELRSQGGVYVGKGGEFIPVPLSYDEFAHFMNSSLEVCVPGLAEHDELTGSEKINLFHLYDPRPPYHSW